MRVAQRSLDSWHQEAVSLDTQINGIEAILEDLYLTRRSYDGCCFHPATQQLNSRIGLLERQLTRLRARREKLFAEPVVDVELSPLEVVTLSKPLLA